MRCTVARTRASAANVIGSLLLMLCPTRPSSAGEDVFETFEQVSVSSSGEAANDLSFSIDITADASKVAFFSGATNLVKGAAGQTFVRNRRTARMIVVSRNSAELVPKLPSTFVRISPNGRFVSFCTTDPNVVKPDRFMQVIPIPVEDRYMDVFVRDLVRGVTRRASTSFKGGMANGFSIFEQYGGPVAGWDLSQDGRYVSWCTTNVYSEDDRNHSDDLFVRDMWSGTVRRIFAEPDYGMGTQCGSALAGSAVAFQTDRAFSVADTNGTLDVYLAKL